MGLSGPLILQMVATSEWPSVMHSFYLIVFGKPVGHREVAPVHSRWKPAREQKRKEGEEET